MSTSTTSRALFASLAALSFLVTTPATAAPTATEPSSTDTTAPARTSSFHADFEVDPTAYVLDGYSLHVGLGQGRFRLDLGAFAMKVPGAIHGKKDFDISFDGFGAKLHYFFFAEQKHLFAGIDGGFNRMLAERKGSDLASRQHQYSLGAHVGWRIPLPAGFYVTPWIGISHSFNAKDVTLQGATYTSNAMMIFPAIHLGYRFQ